jgi:hypothetical protein
MMRTHLQRSSELDEVREAIGLHPSEPIVRSTTSGQSVRWASVPRSNWVESEGYPTGSLSVRMRQLVGMVTAVSGGVALTHQVLAGALAGAHGAGPWSAAATLLAWPVPLAQPILAGIGALVLCAVGALTGGWHHMGSRQNWLLLGASMAAVLGAAPMVLVCAITAAVCVLAIVIGLVILFYLLAQLLR